MTHIKINKKALKQDEVRTFGLNAWDYIEKHQKTLLIAAGAIVVLFIVWKLYNVQKQNVMREANLLFSQAANSFQTALLSDQKEQKEQELQKCLDNCNRILSDYRSSPLASNALYVKGSALFFKANASPDGAKELDEPISIFNEFINRVSSREEKAVGYVALGYAYENKYFLTEDKQLLDAAVSAYEKAIDLGKDKAAGAEAMLCKARLMELQYKDDQAAALLEKVKTDRKRQAALGAKGDTDFKDPQMNFMSQQLKNMENYYSFSQMAQFSLDRLQGQK